MSQKVEINRPSSGEGVSVHNSLTGRDAANAHPMSAITGLEAALAGLGGRQVIAGALLVPEVIWNPATDPQPVPFSTLFPTTPFLTYASSDSSSGYVKTFGIKRWVANGVGNNATLTDNLNTLSYFGAIVFAGVVIGGSTEVPWVRFVTTDDGTTMYATPDELNDRELAALNVILGGYALASHNHNGVYALIGHNHDGVYSLVGHTHPYAPAYAAEWTHTPTTTTRYLQSTGVADATLNLSGSSDTTLPFAQIIGDSGALAAGSRHMAFWNCPAAPSANHKLIGVMVHGGNIDYGSFGEVQTVVAVYDSGDTSTALNNGFWSGDNLYIQPILSNTNPPSFYNARFPITCEFTIPAQSPVSAGDYMVGMGFKAWDDATVPVLPAYFEFESIFWIFRLDPVAIPAGTTKAVIDLSDIDMAAQNDYTLPTLGELPLTVTVISDNALANDQSARFFDSDGNLIGELFAGTTATFGNCGGYPTMLSHQKIGAAPYVLNRVGYTTVNLTREYSGIRYANDTEGAYVCLIAPGIPGIVVIENIASDFFREADDPADWNISVAPYVVSTLVDDSENSALRAYIVYGDDVASGASLALKWDHNVRAYVRVSAL